MDRNTSRLILVLFKRYYRGASIKPCRRVPLWCSFCNIGVKGHFVENVEKSIFFLYNAYSPWKQFTNTIKKCWHYVELCFWSNNFFFVWKYRVKVTDICPMPSGSTQNVFLKFVHQNWKRKDRNYKWSLIIEKYSIWRYFLESFIEIVREITRCMKSKLYHTNLKVGQKLIYF